MSSSSNEPLATNHAPALDDGTKRRLKAAVLELRKNLEDDLTTQLRRLGVDGKKNNMTPVEKLDYLTDAEKRARAAVDVLIEKEKRIALSFAGAVASLVREAAYTHLNRLFGLKCMEVRGLLVVEGECTETITTRPEYGGRPKLLWAMRESDRQYRHGEDAEERLWQDALERACRAVTSEMRVLFDPDDGYALVWPSFACLRSVVDRLNNLPEVVYHADESLGWIYQYFQTEEKARVFEEVRTKRKKIQWQDTIPVTSLYTERYMVDFLLQNSVGALWMEMYAGSSVAQAWPYYVKPASPRSRPPKAVKEWRILDPACGSGHFLVVAFDLLRQLYAEERRLGEEGRVPPHWIVAEADVAETILRENIHGIDIDPRSVQISALALWLKARAAGLAHPPVLNLVVADCVLGKGEAYETLLGRYKNAPEIQKAIKAIWDALQQMRELGSLIRVEEELEAAVGKAQREEAGTFPEWRRDWERYRTDLISDLRRAFEAEARMEDLGHRLFGIEGRKGLDFVELVSRRYDVVCTNPPYMGSKNMGKVLKDFVGKYYTPGKRDLYAAFILRCRELAAEGGYVAMVTQQSWMFQRSLVELRATQDDSRCGGLLREVELVALAHLGPGGFGDISGEVVRSTLLVARCQRPQDDSRFWAFRLVGVRGVKEKALRLAQACGGNSTGVRYEAVQARFLRIPGSPMAYWALDALAELFSRLERLDSLADVRRGLSTGDNERLIRCFWEVSATQPRWRPFAKGGGYRRWYGLRTYVVDWPGARSVMEFLPGARIQNESYYDRVGGTFSQAGSGCLGVRLLPEEEMFEAKSPAVFPQQPGRDLHFVMGLLNCRIASWVLRAMSPGIDINEASVAALPLPSADAALRAHMGDAVGVKIVVA
ncbi:MAG: BREX-1 system adenine-specific DNA-methyltransferase PglX [Planctomycetota bacterium]